VLAVVLGLVVLFVPQLLRLPATQFVGVCGLGLLAGGAAALVWWMRDRADGGPDDGAVV
jgi:protein-S-isoprenylcysteine O-methyltransferase Ste14